VNLQVFATVNELSSFNLLAVYLHSGLAGQEDLLLLRQIQSGSSSAYVASVSKLK